MDLARTATELDLRNEANRLIAAGFMTEREAAALNFEVLLKFWNSSVGQNVRAEAQAGRVQREVPFTARFMVRELQEMGLRPINDGRASTYTGGDEFVIVQGVADLVVFGEDEIWLLDYKTDYFAETELPTKLREYGPQLLLYASALKRIHHKTVTNIWLHFFALGRTEEL